MGVGMGRMGVVDAGVAAAGQAAEDARASRVKKIEQEYYLLLCDCMRRTDGAAGGGGSAGGSGSGSGSAMMGLGGMGSPLGGGLLGGTAGIWGSFAKDLKEHERFLLHHLYSERHKADFVAPGTPYGY